MGGGSGGFSSQERGVCALSLTLCNGKGLNKNRGQHDGTERPGGVDSRTKMLKGSGIELDAII